MVTSRTPERAGIVVRDARAADSAGIAAIYNDAALNTTAIWNDSAVDADNRAAWMAERQANGFPVLVAKAGGEIAGYAAFGPFRPFDGYRLTVESSVYTAAGYRRRGVGRLLVRALIERARASGKHAMIAAIEAQNVASLRLHADLGFRETGRLPEVGCKFGRWLDLVLLQITLDARVRP